jgi:hypothetical protein
MSKIIVRDLRLADIDEIDKIYRRQPELSIPSLDYMIVNAVMEDTKEKRLVAYGAVKLFAEAVLIMNRELPKRDRALALIEAMQTAILYSRDAGVEILYANSNDESFTKVLENRYKFHKVPGTLLCLDLSSTFEDK